MEYIALIHKDSGSDYGVSFPDFPGCITAATTLEEARVAAQEALSLHVEGMVEEGIALPDPRTLDAIMADPEVHQDGPVLGLVVTVEPPEQIERINITMPSTLLRKIDSAAGKGNRSGWLAEAAQARLGSGSAKSAGQARAKPRGSKAVQPVKKIAAQARKKPGKTKV